MNNLFLSKYRDKLDYRYPSMELALNLFYRRGGKVAIETGCVRVEDDWGGGCSTVLFGEYFKDHPGTFYSVDISEHSLEVAGRLCKGLPVTFIQSDSITYLQEFTDQVDLLYLDSLDCSADPVADNRYPQTHQLNELKAIYDRLSPQAVVLLDDCGFENGGKGGLTRPYLAEKGWTEVWGGYQSLWVR